MGQIYTISPHVSFVDALANGLIQQWGDDPLAFSRVTVLLPNRRSCRNLEESILAMREGNPTLLPRIYSFDSAEFIPEAMPAKSPGRLSDAHRVLCMSELLRAYFETHGILDINPLDMAQAIIPLMDELERHHVPHDALQHIVPDELAEHWQITLDVLEYVVQAWPSVLERYHALNPEEYRKAKFADFVRSIEAHPPEHPLIIAGTTASVPSTLELAKTIYQQEQGVVILPGWIEHYAQHATPNQPHYTMLNLIRALEVPPQAIEAWDHGVASSSRPGRSVFLAEAFTDERGHGLEYMDISGMTYEAFETLEEEALAIACRMREHVESPEHTTALICSDRSLAEKVQAQLLRWDIHVDNSMGIPLHLTTEGQLLMLVIEAIHQNFSPVHLLKLLKHPMVSLGHNRAEHLQLVRQLEKQYLRGVRSYHSLAELIAQIAPENHAVKDMLVELETLCCDFVSLHDAGEHDFQEIFFCHIQLAESLSARQLWQGDSGKSLYQFVMELGNIRQDIPVTHSYYTHLLRSLLARMPYRAAYGFHPRLAILSPTEARLKHYDTVIIGGFNEGVFPGNQSDVWINNAMREATGLPPLAYYHGIALHEFIELCGAGEVYITCHKSKAGAPCLPSPWLKTMRMHSKRCGFSISESNEGNSVIGWIREHTAEHVIKAPAPRPPLESRGTHISATRVETLIRNPYALYARNILRLRKLEDIDASPAALEWGNLVHNLMELFAKEPRKDWDSFQQIVTKIIAEQILEENIKHLWRAKLLRLYQPVIAFEEALVSEYPHSYEEISGAFDIGLKGGIEFTLTAKADRIAISPPGGAIILDYKTGSLPSGPEVACGLYPQLPVEALILRHKGYDISQAVNGATALRYVGLRFAKATYEENSFKKLDIEDLIKKYEDYLHHLLSHYFTSDEHAFTASYYYEQSAQDYEQLARYQEWNRQ